MKKLEDSIKARGGDLSSDERKADRIISEQESRRNLSQYICVVDCDAFYASVEELDNPELKGKPFGVGEGVLTTASYEARKFGCVSDLSLLPVFSNCLWGFLGHAAVRDARVHRQEALSGSHLREARFYQVYSGFEEGHGSFGKIR